MLLYIVVDYDISGMRHLYSGSDFTYASQSYNNYAMSGVNFTHIVLLMVDVEKMTVQKLAEKRVRHTL